ncbi:hypothetical protein [Flagellimonas sp. S3867]|uniref:hypothetical protein n=1 Tax=Flagellimonas sp. S3867 TaxID=2768063 RepID=UPI0016883997|nr:hypothetical protein [Flagellimonas sp. S3867]
MKTRKIILLIVFIIGVLSLLLMASFTTRNACEYASSNIEYIKGELQSAIISDDFEMSKYHAFKALNGIEKTRLNFLDCGCSAAIESLEKTSTYLKSATATKSFEDSKEWLHLALENTVIGIKVLRVFEQETSSHYGNDLLVMNTKDAMENEVGTLLPQGDLKKLVHKCLLGFETSLDKVVTEVECEEASRFITKIHEEAQSTLLKTELTVAKKEYHQRVKTIAKEALNKLGECSEE